MITIFSMAFNEELVLPFMISHYKIRFPNCQIVIFDNQSTDNTVNIALSNNCVVIEWDTDNKIDDEKMRILKNNCWKNAPTDWVLFCDPDELLDINEDQLKNEELNNTTIIKSKAFNMVNMEDNSDLQNIKYGIRAENYDKYYLFNKKYIKEINYNHGAHVAAPTGLVKLSNNEYNLYHYKFISPEFNVQRHHYTLPRLSDLNKKMGWGSQWHKTDDQIIQEIIESRKLASKIIGN
jgi:glycosyltransferase involved in cell wall biosynthesis